MAFAKFLYFEEKKISPFLYANNFVLKGTFSQGHRKMPIQEEAMFPSNFQSNICIDKDTLFCDREASF